MRKSIFGTIISSLGIIILLITVFQKNNTEYPETIFNKESSSFREDFHSFLNTTNSTIHNLTTTFSDTNTIKNQKFTSNYFLNFIDNNPYLLSAAYLQGSRKAVVKRVDKTYIIALDSNKDIEIVHWKRIKNGKVISEWEESFDEIINKTSWYDSLTNNPNRIQWFFNLSEDITNDFKTDNELFYAGVYYNSNGKDNIILLRFSRLELLKHFTTYSNFDRVNLIIETNDGLKMDLGTGITETFRQVKTRNKDSIALMRLEHFKKFRKSDSGIFSFNFKGSTYWNSFMRFDKQFGIKYYLLSIPEQDMLISSQSSDNDKYIISFSILLILIGGSLFFVRREIFYNRTKYKFETVAEILSNEDENRYLEFKSSLRWDYRQERTNPDLEQVIIKTICAFGNTDGGILLIGVDDDKKILGLENDFKTLKKPNADFFEIHLRNILHTLMGVRYVSKYIRMNFEETEDGKTVCAIKVFAADEALFLKTKNKNGQNIEKFYVRSGNSSQEIKTISEINDYINSRFKK